jgi:hypothetical protein
MWDDAHTTIGGVQLSGYRLSDPGADLSVSMTLQGTQLNIAMPYQVCYRPSR